MTNHHHHAPLGEGDLPLSRVLLAEDDCDMRDLVAVALRLDGAEVVVARDGSELLERLGSMCAEREPRFRYDLIIADIRMPGCSGLQVLEGMRQAGWNTPMILMTAFSDRATRTRVEEQRGVLFDKPFDVDDLRTAALYLLRPPSSGRLPMALDRAMDLAHASQSSLLPLDQPWRRR